MKILDVWDLRILGKKPGSVGDYSINFLGIYPDWLKQAVKDFIWFKTVSLSTATIINNVRHLKVISYFAEVNKIYLHPQDIDRVFVVNLINHISSSGIEAATITHYLATWKYFFDFCQENNILPKSNGKLIFRDDYPKYKKSQVKDIPDYVLQQLKTKINFLPTPILLIVEILLETGMRISEVCRLKLNSLEQVMLLLKWQCSMFTSPRTTRKRK